MYLDAWKLVAPGFRWTLTLIFVVSGIAHFVNSGFYVRMIPPQLAPAPLLVHISGVCELAGGIGIAVPRFRRAAGIGLIALLIAVFPANVYMALRPELFGDVGSPAAFWIRLPIQLVLIVWVWWCLRK
jgi:uncharacterized membrane protein